MTEFYGPMIYMSTPEHPNTMGVCIVLKEPVDGDNLQNAVEDVCGGLTFWNIPLKAAGKSIIM